MVTYKELKLTADYRFTKTSLLLSNYTDADQQYSHEFTKQTVKPIFHCDAKYLASGVGVGQCPRRQNFALEIPTCWYILALPNTKICVFPDANPRHQSVEYRLRWVPTQNTGIGRTFHVFCVDFICVWYPMQTPFPVEYGLKQISLTLMRFLSIVMGNALPVAEIRSLGQIYIFVYITHP